MPPRLGGRADEQARPGCHDPGRSRSRAVTTPSGHDPFLERAIQIGYGDTMARTREFDTEAAVSRAMELFWTRGYEATSVRDLTGHLGIGQGSLYAAFGDKDGLYRAALEHYRTTLAAAALRSLEEGRTPARRSAPCWSSGSGSPWTTTAGAAWRSTPPASACRRTRRPGAPCATCRTPAGTRSPKCCGSRRSGARSRSGTTRTPSRLSSSPSSTDYWSPRRSRRTSEPSNPRGGRAGRPRLIFSCPESVSGDP